MPAPGLATIIVISDWISYYLHDDDADHWDQITSAENKGRFQNSTNYVKKALSSASEWSQSGGKTHATDKGYYVWQMLGTHQTT